MLQKILSGVADLLVLLTSLHLHFAASSLREQLGAAEETMAKRGELLAKTHESLQMQESTLQTLREEVLGLRAQVEVSDLRLLRCRIEALERQCWCGCWRRMSIRS
jgi:hypothetical protein